jgi:hypothetical protein
MRTKHWIVALALVFALGTLLPGHAQEQDQSSAPPPSEVAPPAAEAAPPAYAPQAQQPQTNWRRFGETAPAAPLPATITLPAGTWITARANQQLSSDHNKQGDMFMGTLLQPIIVNGRVIAHRGQTVSGIVSDVEKAGRVKGTSKLGLQLTDVTIADGSQVPIKTKLTEKRGTTSQGRDAFAIGGTTAAGAAIGAGAAGGFGAGMGAIAGAGASTIGVLLTRGRPTVIYPEDVLIFRLEAPANISTQNAPEAFQPPTPEDYQPRASFQPGARPMGPMGPMGPVPPPYYYSPYYYSPYYYSPYWYGPGLYFGFGPRFYRRW